MTTQSAADGKAQLPLSRFAGDIFLKLARETQRQSLLPKTFYQLKSGTESDLLQG
jgi:hypothetical protein